MPQLDVLSLSCAQNNQILDFNPRPHISKEAGISEDRAVIKVLTVDDKAHSAQQRRDIP